MPFRGKSIVETVRMGLLLAAALAAGSGVARAQGFEALGTRALGMGGAFVAVADDATATYWNPAGLATAALFSTVFEWTANETGESDPARPGEPQGGSGAILAVGTPPLGFTYYRIRTTRLYDPATAPAAVAGPRGAVSSLVTHHTGVNLAQSIGEHLHVGTTLKYVIGQASLGARGGGDYGSDALDDVAGRPSHTSNAFDLDLGAMAVFGAVRAGLVIRNVTEPTFKAYTAGELGLQRQARAGIAWQATDTMLLSADVDLTRSDNELEVGRRRHVAVGGERWFANKRLGVRGGFRVNTLDDADPVASGGFSVGVTPSIFIDTFISHGSGRADRAWGVAGHVAF
jgi:hypothetical protein